MYLILHDEQKELEKMGFIARRKGYLKTDGTIGYYDTISLYLPPFPGSTITNWEIFYDCKNMEWNIETEEEIVKINIDKFQEIKTLIKILTNK